MITLKETIKIHQPLDYDDHVANYNRHDTEKKLHTLYITEIWDMETLVGAV